MNTKPSKVCLVDCTFRDGGYYNRWDFRKDLVAAYLQAMAAANVDVIEIGYRSNAKGAFEGAFAYCTDIYLAALQLPKGPRIAVMVNAKELLVQGDEVGAAVNRLFESAEHAPVDIVRIATHFADVPQCKSIAKRLKELGYQVCLNLMQASGKSSAELTAIAREVEGWGCVDVLYVADSFGNLRPEGVREIVRAIGAGWSGEIGVHTHDNMGLAQVNVLASLEAGATWIDATILGMGRGAGNMRTEYLLVEMQQQGIGQYFPDAVFPLVLEEFEALRQQYGWGSNLLYYLSAIYEIHPAYVQELLQHTHYETHHIMAALDSLRQAGGNAYNQARLEQAVSSGSGSFEGAWSPRAMLEGRDLLVIGSGASVSDHLDGINQFIDRTAPVVFCLNAKETISSARVSAYVACHRTRLLLDIEKFRHLGKPLILPIGAVPNEIRDSLQGVEVLDYGMCVEKDRFDARDKGCVVPSSLAAAYAIALGMAAGAARILMAGFDGYAAGDQRQKEMVDVLEQCQRMGNAVPIVAVTPTTYPITQRSVYEPGL